FRQMVRYGRGRVRLLRKHPDTFSLPSLVPAAFLAGVVLGPVFACLLSVLWLAYFAALGVYTAVVLATSVATALRNKDLRLAPLLPAVFATVHAGAGAGFWWEALLGAACNLNGERTHHGDHPVISGRAEPGPGSGRRAA